MAPEDLNYPALARLAPLECFTDLPERQESDAGEELDQPLRELLFEEEKTGMAVRNIISPTLSMMEKRWRSWPT